MKVTINQKKYNVPELTLGHYTKMEEQGFSILDAIRKNQFMLMAMGFVCAVVDVDRDEAEDLLTQHVYGGGNILDIVNVFRKAIAESDFFKKMLGAEEEKPAMEEEKTEEQNEEMNLAEE